jgi:MATE family multidrug resistance protein
MASQPADIAAGTELPAPEMAWRAEIIDTLRLAWPMAVTQLGQVAMMTTDLMLLGRLGDQVVAATALAHTVLFAAFTVGMGIVSAVAPLASQAFGARQPRIVRRALRVGLWAALMIGAPATALQLWGQDILIALGQTPDAAAMAGRYLDGLAWSLVPAWAFMAFRNFMGAVNRPEPALWITLAAIPANLLLAYSLIYGTLGLPQLDLLGAGLATTLVNIGMCAVAIWVCYARHPFKKYRVLGRFWRSDWPLFAKLIEVGAPVSGTFLLEFGVFAAAALLMGMIGTTALAAHQIALQTAAIMFMVPFGISLAATVRVGHAAGAAMPAQCARRALPRSCSAPYSWRP